MKPKKPRPLTHSHRYESFIKSRDKVLEEIHRKYLRALDRTLDHLQERTKEIIAHTHVSHQELYMLKRATSMLEHRLDQEFHQVERDVVVLLYRMRGTIYGLSVVGQAQAITRATGKESRVDLSTHKVHTSSAKPMRAGGPIEHRVWICFERLKRKVVDAYQMGILMDDTTQNIIDRVMAAFPKAKLSRSRPELKHSSLKESEDDEGATTFAMNKHLGVVNGVIEPDLWEQMVDDYKNEEIPFYEGRTPIDAESYYEEHGQYEWQLESETTQEFVDQVRAGEMDAANENGITDFVVIAVLDSATDECCAERDGMTITEIEDALDSGELDDEVCEGTTPPFHFNCATAGHTIETDKGPRLVEDIKVGDMVLTHLGRYRRVTRTLQSEAAELVVVELKDGTRLEVTPEHPLMSDGKWILAADLIEGGSVQRSDTTRTTHGET